MTELSVHKQLVAHLATWPADTPEVAWGPMARLAADVAPALIELAAKTPYIHLEGYMERSWLANPFPRSAAEAALGEHRDDRPSLRVHHILREDLDRVPHDHPWQARTIILRGWYRELRLMPNGSEQEFLRQPGDTAPLEFGEFHRIIEVSPGGVWTLFVTWKYQGTWGFLVDGKKVPYKTYLDL